MSNLLRYCGIVEVVEMIDKNIYCNVCHHKMTNETQKLDSINVHIWTQCVHSLIYSKNENVITWTKEKTWFYA